jgi:hypothetical protein
MKNRLDIDSKVNPQDPFQSSFVSRSIGKPSQFNSKAAVENSKSDREISVGSDVSGPSSHAGAFLAMLQDQSPQANEVAVHRGTIHQGKTLNKHEEDKISSFSIELKDFGSSDVRVVQAGSNFEVTIELADKSKLPANPILFTQVVKQLLAERFGKNFSVKVR